jgi:transcriptional regulator with XRE-family HTH domain
VVESTDRNIRSDEYAKSDQTGKVARPRFLDRHAQSRLDVAIRRAGGYRKVAARAGISPRTLTRLVSGESVRWSTYLPIATAIGVDPDWLLTGVRDPRAGLREQDYVEYILVAKPTPGIVPRDLLAYTLCGQRLPFQPNHIIPAAAMASLTMPPSEAPKSHQRPH